MPRTLEVTTGKDGTLVVARDRPTAADCAMPVLVGLLGAITTLALPGIELGDALRRPAESAPALAAAGAGATLVGLALGGWAASRVRLGRWHLDAAGVAWHPQAAPPTPLAWGEVARVRWWPNLVTLEGPAGRMEWVQVDFRPDDWRALRARVESALSPRFDLTIRPKPIEFRPGRVLLLLAPVGLAAAWLARALPTLTIPQLYASVLAMMALLLAPLPYVAWVARTEGERLNPTWRTPRAASPRSSSRTRRGETDAIL